MSGGSGSSRRRRIAGERSGTGAPAAPTTPATPPAGLTRPTPRRPVRPVRPGAPGAPDTSGEQARDRPGRPRREPRAPRTPRREGGARPGAGLRALLSPPRRERVWFVPLALLAACCLLAGLVLGVRGAQQVWQERAEVGARDAAASAAGTAIETMYTYDSDSLQEDAAAAEQLMTPTFRSEYAEIIDTLGELGDQRQISISSTARDTAAMPCGDECSARTQRVMVFFDLSRTTGEGTVPSVFGNRVALTMVERDGGWLVDEIEVL